MHRRTLTFFVLLAAATVPAPAFAHEPSEGNIWATVGPYAYRTVTSSDLIKDQPYTGLAIISEGDVDMNGGVEIALIYLDKTYVRERQDGALAERIKRMYITTGYRHWFTNWFSAGLAFFSSYSMGDPKVVGDTRTFTPTPEQQSLPLAADDRAHRTSARRITEYGGDASLQWEIWGEADVAVVADARYSFTATRQQGEDADVASLTIGFKYRVPKRGGIKSLP